MLSPAAARRLIAASADRQPARDRARRLAASLTDREAQVPACLGEGLSNAQIAARLYLSEARVKGYVSRMLDKLGCANRAQAGLLAHDAPVSSARSPGSEAAGWNSGWVPGRPGCVLRPDVRARRVRRASRARRESAAVAIMSLTRSVTSCCRISGCMGSSWVRRAAAVVPGLVEQLTARELEVLALLAAGAPNPRIAEQLVVTLDTVKKHVSHLLGKLGAANRTEAVTRARQLGLIP